MQFSRRPQRHVDSEIRAVLSVLPGSVEGVDDPHPLGVQARWVVFGFFAQNCVVWSNRRKEVQDQIVRRRIGSIAQLVRRLFIPDGTVFGNEVPSYLQQELTGVLGDVARDGGIGTWIVHPFPPVLASSPLDDRSL